jgi:enoyl-[acyl-carrier protein] reductase II
MEFSVGSRFAASIESSAHDFKETILNVKEGDTQLTLKEL